MQSLKYVLSDICRGSERIDIDDDGGGASDRRELVVATVDLDVVGLNFFVVAEVLEGLNFLVVVLLFSSPRPMLLLRLDGVLIEDDEDEIPGIMVTRRP